MKRLCLLLFMLPLAGFAQTDPNSAINAGVNLGTSLFANAKNKKKQKQIDESVTAVSINGKTISILRVPADKIISNAKPVILKIQSDLQSYYTHYKNNEPVNLPDYFEDLGLVKNSDADWPTDYYQFEFNAYKQYAAELAKKERLYKDSILVVRKQEEKLRSDSLAAELKYREDSLAYVARIDGYHFIGVESTLFKEKPSAAAKTMGKIYRGSYVQLLEDKATNGFVKIDLEGVEGYVNSKDLVEWIEEIEAPYTDLELYKSRHYYKYEENEAYAQAAYAAANPTPARTPAKRSGQAKQSSRSSKQSSYITGPMGGCYYISSSGEKVYVDRSYCR